ncbi:hypothetical protein [Microbacterium nymphoidis]|uniref:hypothetical protein n=1 Tax=Microbacterium nymphoidis TaxID=2898586 RepID=UPI001E558960|nr:hypothetical protein [Microbacterium nymphoidis]MCD2498233.1 hypothetical protein [Microbacterium nymphoidis]
MDTAADEPREHAGILEPALFDDAAAGHPSQAEGEDSDRDGDSADPRPAGHPSQAEGDDD